MYSLPPFYSLALFGPAALWCSTGNQGEDSQTRRNICAGKTPLTAPRSPFGDGSFKVPEIKNTHPHTHTHTTTLLQFSRRPYPPTHLPYPTLPYPLPLISTIIRIDETRAKAQKEKERTGREGGGGKGGGGEARHSNCNIGNSHLPTPPHHEMKDTRKKGKNNIGKERGRKERKREKQEKQNKTKCSRRRGGGAAREGATPRSVPRHEDELCCFVLLFFLFSFLVACPSFPPSTLAHIHTHRCVSEGERPDVGGGEGEVKEGYAITEVLTHTHTHEHKNEKQQQQQQQLEKERKQRTMH